MSALEQQRDIHDGERRACGFGVARGTCAMPLADQRMDHGFERLERVRLAEDALGQFRRGRLRRCW